MIVDASDTPLTARFEAARPQLGAIAYRRDSCCPERVRGGQTGPQLRAAEHEVRAATVNGAAGAVIYVAGRATAIMGFLVRDGRVAAIDVLADPQRISKLDLSALDSKH